MESNEAIARARYAASRHNSIGWRTVKALLEVIDAQAEELVEDEGVIKMLRRQRDTAEQELHANKQEIQEFWFGVQA